MLPETERKSYDKAIKALKKRSCPVDIEELHSLKFHTGVQGDEKLGIDIQKLGHKAFPTMKGKKFIKGHSHLSSSSCQVAEEAGSSLSNRIV